MPFRSTVILILSFVSFAALAQTKMDSLELQLKKAASDNEKCDLLCEMALYIINKDPDRAAECANKALALAQSANYKDGEGFAIFNLGNVDFYQDNYQEGLKKFDQAEQIFKSTKNNKGLGYVECTRGEVQTYEGKYSDALTNLFAGMNYFEEAKDNVGIARVDINIGLIHYYQKNYAEALRYFNEALLNADEVRRGDASLYIGKVYIEQDNYAQAKKYLETANEIGHKNQDNYIIADCLYLLARTDVFYGDKASAEKRFLKALEINEELENFSGISGCCNQLGLLYLGQTRLDDAVKYFRKAYAVSQEKGIKEETKQACLGLSNSFNYQKMYDSAYFYLKQNNRINEELLSEEASKKLAELEASLAAQKREAEVTSERKVRAFTEKVFVFCGIGVFIVMIAISYILYNRNKLKQRANQKLEALNKDILHQRDIIEEKHKEITDSINYAERIQRAMLASKVALDTNFNEAPSRAAVNAPADIASASQKQDNYFIFFKPKDVVSGDFYWASALSNGKFAMVTADSTGHGVPGAIMSMLNMNSLKEAVKHELSEPADILNYTRSVIISTLANDGSAEGGKDGMDCCLLVYDLANKKLSFAAANNPVWIVRGTEVLEYKSDKMPVGRHARQDNPFTQHQVDLQPGDVVYTLTDGFPDQFGGAKGKKFMSKNLRELLTANAQLPMREQRSLLDKTFREWVGNLEQVDDVTVIGVRIL
jgi:serine phosphatase RsbU (regulator of sigma subunit)